MLPIGAIGDKFFSWLCEIDEGIGKLVAAEGCCHCEGRLHRADYPRKPRGALIAAEAEEAFSWRISYCCGRRGCRLRATPPSVRFLGRRVYFGATVLIASMLGHAAATARKVKRLTGIPRRTVDRWRSWWQSGFVTSRLYEEQRSRFMPPLAIEALPASLIERFASACRDTLEALARTLLFLAPLTTQSVADGTRFVRFD